MASTTDASRTPRPTTPGRAGAWGVTALLVALMMLNFADKSVLGLASGPLSRDLGLTAGEYGRVAGAFYLLFSLSAVVAGLLATRLRATAILTVLAVLWSVSVAPVLLFATLPALYAGRVLLGAAEGPTSPLVVHAVQKWFLPRDRAVPVALTQMGGALGIVVIAPALGWIIDRHGWRAAFLALSLAGLLWVAAWLAFGREGPLSTYRADLSDQELRASTLEAVTQDEVRLPYRKLFLNGTALGNLAVGAAAYWTLAVSVSWLPRYLEDVWGHTSSSTGRLVTLPALLSAVTLVLVPWLSGRLRRTGTSSRVARGYVAAACCAVSGLALLGAAHTTSQPLALAGAAVGFGLPNVVFPLGFLNSADISPVAQRPVILAVGTAVASLTGVVAPGVTGDFLDAAASARAGFAQAFTLAAVLLLAAAAVAALLIDPGRDARRLGLMARTEHKEETHAGA